MVFDLSFYFVRNHDRPCGMIIVVSRLTGKDYLEVALLIGLYLFFWFLHPLEFLSAAAIEERDYLIV